MFRSHSGHDVGGAILMSETVIWTTPSAIDSYPHVVVNVYAEPIPGTFETVTTADGTSINTVSLGSGSPVVLAHGYAFDMHGWNIVAAGLVERGHRVIAFDQRGHGKTTIGSNGLDSEQMASDYVAVIEHYDVHDAVLVGHSMGGFLGIRFLVDYPDVVRARLKGVVLISTFAGDVNRSNPQNKLQIPLIQTGIISKIVGNNTLGTAFAKSLMGDDKNPDIILAFRAGFGAQNLGPTVPVLKAMVRENRYDRLGEIDLPCTILVGDKDKTTPTFHADDLNKGIVGSTLIRVPGMGHLLIQEDAQVVIDEICALAD